ncbi:MAG: hypothetical protein Kow0069_39170 [Promethearchaeota archaeon]
MVSAGSPPVIVDAGTRTTRVGFAGEDAPRLRWPTVRASPTAPLLRRRVVPALDAILPDATFTGEDALAYGDVLELDYFWREHRDFSCLEALLRDAWRSLGAEPEASPVVWITPSHLGPDYQERVASFLFSTLGVPRALFPSAALCALFAANRSSGVVVSLGDGHTSVQSIFRGFPGPFSLFESDVTGRTLTKFFRRLLPAESAPMSEDQAARAKERCVACAGDLDRVLREVEAGETGRDQELELPTGERHVVNRERYLVPEAYFQPWLVASSADPLHELVWKSVESWERGNRGELLEAVVLAGGGSKVPGLPDRLERELRARVPGRLGEKVRVLAARGREDVEWLGASVLVTKGVPEDKWRKNPRPTAERGEGEPGGGAGASGEGGEAA